MDTDKIRLIDLASESKNSQLEGILSDFKTVYQTSQFVLGQAVEEFEQEYAKLADCKFSVGLNSGTDALFLGLRIFGVGPGDEVITAANSFIASAAAISLVGATPVFADISEDYNIDPEQLEAAITPKTKAIIPVHLTGNPCKMEKIMEIASRHNLVVLEDAAQAVGASHKGKKVGSFGAFGCFSLHPLKNLHVWGDGGMATTNDADFDKKMRQQRNHGLVNRDESEFFSYNSRLDTLQAVVGLRSIRLLEETIASRRANAKIYDERLKELSEYVQTPIVDHENDFHVYHLYVAVVKDRTKLQEYLLADGIETKIHYPIPIHLQKAAEYLGYKRGSLPVTERLAEGILSLPIRENLSPAQIEKVCDSLTRFYKS